MLETEKISFFDYLFKDKLLFCPEKNELLKKQSYEYLDAPIKIIAILVAAAGLLSMVFEIRYFNEYAINVYFNRLSATLTSFVVLVLMFTGTGKNNPLLMVHLLMFVIIASSGYMIYLIPSTLVFNAQIVGLVIFTSALFLNWNVKNQIITAIYYNLTFASAVLLNDVDVYFIPNMYESVIFVIFLSFISVLGSAFNYRLRVQLAERSFQISRSAKQYKDLFNNSAEGIFQTTIEGNFKICNPALAKILGYDSVEELMKINISEKIFKYPEERYKLLNEIEENGSVQEYMLTLKKKDGSDIIVRLNDRKLYDTETGEYYFEGNMQDITAQTYADIERRKMEEELKQEKIKSDALAKEAFESNSFKSKFLASMSHEIRTPLNGVLGYLTLIEGEAYKNKNEMKLFIESAKQSAESLLDIVNDVLDLSKIESGKIELDETDFNFKEVIDESLNIVMTKAKEKNLYLLKDINPNIPVNLTGDPVRIRQILVNLLSNAIKFTEKGKVELKVNFDKINDEKINIKVSVSDTGMGIPGDFINSLFKPFSRVNRMKSPQTTGTGLGLVICKEFINLMEGEINVNSEEGKGSVFYFNIKLKKQNNTGIYGEEITKNHYCETSRKETEMVDEIDVKQLNKTEIKKKREKVSILLAEDNMINQKVILRILNDAGFKTESVTNGLLALEAVKNKNYTLVLMDIQMPEMDGLTATKNIRELDNGKSKIPVIAITAHAMKGDREKCLEAGMDDYATKPIIAEELIKIVDKWAFLNGTINSVFEKPEEEAVLQQEDEMIDGFDFEHLNKMSLGSPDFQRELLTTYIEDVTVRMEKLWNYIETNNAEKVGHEAHTIKGASLSIGALKVGEAALAIELSGKNNDLKEARLKFEKLKDTLAETEKIIKEFLEKELS